MEPTPHELSTPPPYAARRIDDTTWEIPLGTRDDMRVPARVFADDALLADMTRDRSLRQLVDVTTLPGIVFAACGMPDMHEGYGFPVGGVAGTEWPDGVVSPGGIGFDINCGVRLLASEVAFEDARAAIPGLVHELSRSIPAGYGRSGRMLTLDRMDLAQVLEQGAPWLVRSRRLGTEDDLARMESGGVLPGGRFDTVSERAKDRGHDQLCTLGGGNHFVEVQVVDELFDEETARAFGLAYGHLVVLVHTGSRGLGHQVCSDAVRVMDAAMRRSGITVPDRQLACAPLTSREGKNYLSAMAAAANFAFCNRQAITHRIREVFRRTLGPRAELRLVYDLAHNTAKIERHEGKVLCVHRKGATRAFGPGREELPADFRATGQPVLIPGSMGTTSWVLAGTEEAEYRSLASACHGAGRAMSRTAAKHQVKGSELRHRLEAQGITVRCPSNEELAEEAPEAYKDVTRVVDVVHRAGLARKVARLRPVGVVKG